MLPIYIISIVPVIIVCVKQIIKFIQKNNTLEKSIVKILSTTVIVISLLGIYSNGIPDKKLAMARIRYYLTEEVELEEVKVEKICDFEYTRFCEKSLIKENLRKNMKEQQMSNDSIEKIMDKVKEILK